MSRAPSARPPEPGAAWRKAERERLIAARSAIPDAARAKAQAAIEAALEARLPPGACALVGGYWPIRGEVDPLPYLIRVLAAGAAAALPAVVARGEPLQFRPWTPEAAMASGPWDILHPAEGPPVTPAALLIPLVGFDAAGHRLGYGGGYYDRTLAALRPRPLALGLGFELGRLASVRPEPHDHPMDLIITEAGVVEPDGKT
jgi:5-formyltetrahydrofolate cyclo-ligase